MVKEKIQIFIGVVDERNRRATSWLELNNETLLLDGPTTTLQEIVAKIAGALGLVGNQNSKLSSSDHSRPNHD
jgi:hypothetical protein